MSVYFIKYRIITSLWQRRRMKIQWPAAPPYYIFFIVMSHTTYVRNTFRQLWRRIGSVLDSQGPQCLSTILSSWTAQGWNRVKIRAMLNQHSLRLLLASVWSQEKRGTNWTQKCEIRDCCAHRDVSPTQDVGSSFCAQLCMGEQSAGLQCKEERWTSCL